MKKYFIQPMPVDTNIDLEFYYSEIEAEATQVYIGGNSQYVGLNNDLRKDVEALIDDAWGDLDCILGAEGTDKSAEELGDEIAEALNAYFKKEDGTKLSNSELIRLYTEVYDVYGAGALNNNDDELAMDARILSILHGKPFVTGTIRGSSQGDWQNYICPESEKDYVTDYVESVYFGTGTEVKCYELPAESVDDLDHDYYIFGYAPSSVWGEKGLKEWAAKQMGCRPEEIEVLPEDYSPEGD